MPTGFVVGHLKRHVLSLAYPASPVPHVPQWGTELAVRGHLSQQLTGSGKAFNDSDDLFLSIAELN
jgi:hypothetical protein